jgi:hypothetical protein
MWICLGYRVYILDSSHIVYIHLHSLLGSPDRSHSWRRLQDPSLFAHKAQPRFRRSLAYKFFWGLGSPFGSSRCRPSVGALPQPTGPSPIFRTTSILISAQEFGSQLRQVVSTIPLFRFRLLHLQYLPRQRSLLVCLHRQS